MRAVDSHGEVSGQLLLLLHLLVFDGAGVSLPRISEIDGVRVHNLILGHDDASRTGLLLFFIFLLILRHVDFSIPDLEFLLLASLLCPLIGLLSEDVFLEFGLHLGRIHILQQLVVDVGLDGHELGADTLAVDVLHDLVITGELFLVSSHDSVAAINSRIRHELLEVNVVHKPSHVSIEHNIVSHAHAFFVVLVVLSLRDAVG